MRSTLHNLRAYLEGKKIKMSDGISALITIVKYCFTPFSQCFRPELPPKYLRSYQRLTPAAITSKTP